MPLRTEESLKKLFAESRARNEKKKKDEQLKYKKASQSVKKALADKLSIEQEKVAQKAQEQQIEAFSRTLCIYNTKYIERYASDEDLYQTREELMQAEQRGEGKINWDRLNELIEQTKLQIYGNSKRYKTKTNNKDN